MAFDRTVTDHQTKSQMPPPLAEGKLTPTTNTLILTLSARSNENERINMAALKRILLVEDNERDVELTLAALEEHNLANEVVVARDGMDALDYLYQRGKYTGRVSGLPAVVLLDLNLPKVDGLEVLQRMKIDPILKQVPVVMVTSSRVEQDLVRSYELGVNAYVVKPVDFQKFTESMRQIGFFWAIINEPPPAAPK